jgi:hypothetical protein
MFNNISQQKKTKKNQSNWLWWSTTELWLDSINLQHVFTGSAWYLEWTITLYSNHNQYTSQRCSVSWLHIPVAVKTGFGDDYQAVNYSYTVIPTMYVWCILMLWLSVIIQMLELYNEQWTFCIPIPVLPIYQFSAVCISPRYSISTMNIPVFPTDYVFHSPDHSAAPGCDVVKIQDFKTL